MRYNIVMQKNMLLKNNWRLLHQPVSLAHELIYVSFNTLTVVFYDDNFDIVIRNNREFFHTMILVYFENTTMYMYSYFGG